MRIGIAAAPRGSIASCAIGAGAAEQPRPSTARLAQRSAAQDSCGKPQPPRFFDKVGSEQSRDNTRDVIFPREFLRLAEKPQIFPKVYRFFSL